MSALTVPLLGTFLFAQPQAEPEAVGAEAGVAPEVAPIGLEFGAEAESEAPAQSVEPSANAEAEAQAARPQEEIETFVDIDAFNAAVEATMLEEGEDEFEDEFSVVPDDSAAAESAAESQAELERKGTATLPQAPPRSRFLARVYNFESLYPRIWLGLGAGGRFSGDINSIVYSLSGAYYLIPQLGAGLRFQHRMQFADRGVIFPGPDHIVLMLAELYWLALPQKRLTPLVSIGLGPMFYSGPSRPLGRWSAALDMIARLGPVLLRVGMAVGAEFPLRKYEAQFSNCGPIDSYCSFSLEPRIGLSFGLGG